MKKRATVMAARFSFVWMFPNFLLLSPNSRSFLSEFSPNQTLLSPNFHCNECFKIVKMTSIVTLNSLLQRIKVKKKI